MGKTQYLYFGRGGQNEGVWLGENKPVPFLRHTDTFLEYIRKHLSSTTLNSFILDEKDRIFSFVYNKWGHENKFSLFYLGPKLYFSNHYYDPIKKQMFLYKSWSKSGEILRESDFSHFDEVGRRQIDRNIKNKAMKEIDALIQDEQKLAEINKVTSKKEKFYKRKIQNITNDLKKVSSWPLLFEVAQSEADFSSYPKKSKISGIKINFDSKEHFKRRDEVFQKVKNFKKAMKILDERLLKTTEEYNNKAIVKEINKLTPIKPFWNNMAIKPTSQVITSDAGYRVFIKDGFKLGVGLTAKGNDDMRKNWATKG